MLAHRIENPEPFEIPFVVGHDDALVCERGCSDNGVKGASGPALSPAVRHESGPDQAGFLVKRQHASHKQASRTSRPREPLLELSAPCAGRQVKYASA